MKTVLLPIGKANIMRKPGDVCIVGYRAHGERSTRSC